MRSKALITSLAVCAIAWTGCAEEAPAPASTEDLTTDLLNIPLSDGRSTPIAADESLAQDGPRVPVSNLGFNRGDTTAVLKVVELSDFGCGYCRQFHAETFPMIRNEFIGEGKVEWKFVPYVTGMFDNSLAVTEAGECVLRQDPVAYEILAARLWSFQQDWKGSDEPDVVVRQWVTEISGVDMAEFDQCMTDDVTIPRIAQATTLARQIGVRGTPTFVPINWPPIQGALPTEVFRELLDAMHGQELERQAGGAAAGSTTGDSGG